MICWHLFEELCRCDLPQICNDRQGEQFPPEQPAGKEQHLEILDLACFGVQACDDLVPQLLRFLLRVGWDGVDIQNICITVILES